MKAARDAKGRFVRRNPCRTKRPNLDAYTDSTGNVHPIRGTDKYSETQASGGPGVSGLRTYAKQRGWTVRALQDHPKGYKYNMRGNRGNMYAKTLESARWLIAHNQRAQRKLKLR